MKLLFLILNKVEVLNELLEHLANEGVKGATIINSKGMARSLSHYSQSSILGSLRHLLNPEHEENKTILIVLSEEKVPVAVRVIEEIVGDLTLPDTGILFTIPVDFEKGVIK